MSGQIALQISQIFSNTALHKTNKALFITNPKLLAMMIVLLTNEKYPMFQRAISSQFMVNLMYKSTAAIALFKKEEIFEENKEK